MFKDHLVHKVHKEHQVQWLAPKDHLVYKERKGLLGHKEYKVQ